MKTASIRDLRLKVDALEPDSRSWLDLKLKELTRTERKERSFWGRLKSLFLPADWFRGDLADYARGRVLVVGCGRGLESLALGAVGLDISLSSLRVAGDFWRHLDDARGSVLGADGARLPFAGGVFDTVLSDNVVEHMPGSILPGHFREVLRVLKPGGRYAFHTPNGIYENPPQGPEHISLHSYAEWEKMALDAGFVDPRTPRRRSGELVAPDWKKDFEKSFTAATRPMGTSHKGVRMVTLVVTKPS